MTTIPTFTVGKYDGPETFACKMTDVMFSDGKIHLICTNDDVPPDYWPKDVYQINDSGEYGVIGTYKLNAGQYEFTPKKGGGLKTIAENPTLIGNITGSLIRNPGNIKHSLCALTC
jgi:hypothetical protein